MLILKMYTRDYGYNNGLKTNILKDFLFREYIPTSFYILFTYTLDKELR